MLNFGAYWYIFVLGWGIIMGVRGVGGPFGPSASKFDWGSTTLFLPLLV